MRIPTRRIVAILATVAMFSALGGCASDDGSDTGSSVGLELHPEGVGPYELGDPAQFVIDGVSSLIGGWDGDSAEEGGPLPHAICGDQVVRQVSWGNLVLFFGLPEDGTFVSWAYGFDPILGNGEDERGLGLRTTEGLGLGTVRADAERLYGERIDITDEPTIDLAAFAIDPDDADHMGGVFDAAADPDAEVMSIEHAPRCEQP